MLAQHVMHNLENSADVLLLVSNLFTPTVLVLAVYGVYLANNILPQFHALEDAAGGEDYFYRYEYFEITCNKRTSTKQSQKQQTTYPDCDMVLLCFLTDQVKKSFLGSWLLFTFCLGCSCWYEQFFFAQFSCESCI